MSQNITILPTPENLSQIYDGLSGEEAQRKDQLERLATQVIGYSDSVKEQIEIEKALEETRHHMSGDDELPFRDDTL